MERYLPTGNEMISLPKLNADTAAIEDLTFLSMQQRGMIELCGTEDEPLMQPFLTIDGAELPMQDLSWSREHFWIPVGQKETQSVDTGWRARLRGPYCGDAKGRLSCYIRSARSVEQKCALRQRG